MRSVSMLLFPALLALGLSLVPTSAEAAGVCKRARRTCLSAANLQTNACKQACKMLFSGAEKNSCVEACQSERSSARAQCETDFGNCRLCRETASDPKCPSSACQVTLKPCKLAEKDRSRACEISCSAEAINQEGNCKDEFTGKQRNECLQDAKAELRLCGNSCAEFRAELRVDCANEAYACILDCCPSLPPPGGDGDGDGPPPGPSGSCDDGKPNALVFQYTGDSCSEGVNSQTKDKCSGDPNGAQRVTIVVTKDEDKVTVSPDANIALGGMVTFTATGDRLASNLKFDIRTDSTAVQTLKIHTSCSDPLIVGEQFGSMLLLDFIPEN